MRGCAGRWSHDRDTETVSRSHALNLHLNEEQKLLQRTVRAFAENEVKPLAREIDETGNFLAKRFARRRTGLDRRRVTRIRRWRRASTTSPIPSSSRKFLASALHWRDSLRAEFAVLRSNSPLRHRRTEEEISCALRAWRKNWLLRADRAAGGFKRVGSSN